MTKKYIARDATIAITYRCNSRCTMCNIWQIENPQELPLEAFNNLSEDLRYINLSGGEPFLRADLPEIVEVVKQQAPQAQIIISSNGILTELVTNSMAKILEIDPQIGVRISLDGLGLMHDEVRGVTGAYDAVMKTIHALKNLGVRNLGFSFTIMDKNVHHLKDVYLLSKKMDLQLALAVVQNSDIYFAKADNKITYIGELLRGLDFVIDSELATWNPKRWGRAFYNYGLKLYAKKNERLLKSGAGIDSLFIDPQGNIYPSNLINIKMGNLLEHNLDEIWNSQTANEKRPEIKEKNKLESWIVCTIRGEMKKHILRAGFWAIKNKLRVILKKD